MENVSSSKTTTAKERHSCLHSHRYIFHYSALYTCRLVLSRITLCLDWWNIGTR